MYNPNVAGGGGVSRYILYAETVCEEGLSKDVTLDLVNNCKTATVYTVH